MIRKEIQKGGNENHAEREQHGDNVASLTSIANALHSSLRVTVYFENNIPRHGSLGRELKAGNSRNGTDQAHN
jgi:hypothetical protein